MAKLGKMAFDDGYTRIIVAGGETSGAVALALGFDAFIIGESIAPGVPVLIPLHNQNAVSYTHLDVYKRQRDGCAAEKSGGVGGVLAGGDRGRQ